MGKHTNIGADGRLMLNLADIEQRLGIYLSAKFIEVELGVPHQQQERRALLWEQSQMYLIRRKLIGYLEELDKRDV